MVDFGEKSLLEIGRLTSHGLNLMSSVVERHGLSFWLSMRPSHDAYKSESFWSLYRDYSST